MTTTARGCDRTRLLLHAIAALLVAITQPIGAQTPSFHFSLTLTEVHAGTPTPVANPDGLIGPGEGILFELASLRFEPEVGTILQTPAGPGPVVGLGAFNAVLWGVGGAEGAWSHIDLDPAWSTMSPTPMPSPGGNILSPLALAQFPWPTANPQNPITSAIRAVWTPASYEPRTVLWIFEGNSHTGWGSLLVQYGTDPQTGLPVYQPVAVPHNSFTGNRLNEVRIVPSPAVGVPAPLAALYLLSRRRSILYGPTAVKRSQVDAALSVCDPVIGREYRPGFDLRDDPRNSSERYPQLHSPPCSSQNWYDAGQVISGIWTHVLEDLKVLHGTASGLERARQLHVDWMHLTSGGDDCDAAHPGTFVELHSPVYTDTDELAIVCNAFDEFDVPDPTGDCP